MTSLLEKAINKISKLSSREQDEIAELILSEVEDEKLWYKKFKNSQDKLLKLSDEALKELKKGKTKSMDL